MRQDDYEKYLDKIEQGISLLQGVLQLERQFGFFKANFVEKKEEDSKGDS